METNGVVAEDTLRLGLKMIDEEAGVVWLTGEQTLLEAVGVPRDDARTEALRGKTLGVSRFCATTDILTRILLRWIRLENAVNIRQLGGTAFRAWNRQPSRLSLELTGKKGAPIESLADNSIVDRIVKEGFVEPAYRKR